VIPARNEAAVVARSIRSLEQQSYAGAFRIVLVDDDSNDGTAVVARAADVSGRLTVVRAAPLPAGWAGKLWAVSQGVEEAGPADYLLLTDADIVHPPQNLLELVARAESGYDLVSYMAKLKCESPAERALIPAFVFFFFLLYPPAWIRNPRGRTAGAAGGCILIRREMLERIGGIAAIRGELIDDCALARAVKRAGGRVWLGLSEHTLSIRDYATFGEIGRMISRTAFTQLRYSPLLLAGTLLGLMFTYLLPVALTIGGSPLGAAAWLMMSVCYWPALRFYGRSSLWAPLLPLIATFYMACTVHSAVQYWQGTGGQWKGRSQANGRPK
jgi:hopene-associated glycosyltransferase HpnB